MGRAGILCDLERKWLLHMLKRPKNLGLMFEWHAGRSRQLTVHLDRPLDIEGPDGPLFYNGRALADLVAEASGWLRAAGVGRGDHVAVVKPNHFDMIVLAAAAARIGAVAALVSAADTPHHHAALLDRIRPVVSIISSDVLERAASAGLDLRGHGTTIVLGRDADPARADELDLKSLRGKPVPKPDPAPDDAPMFITHTSGTTGVPKLVVHSATSNHYASRLELTPFPVIVNRRSDTTLVSISFAHSRSLAWIGAQLKWAPAKVVVASRYEPESVEKVFEQHLPTTVEATPNVYQRWKVLAERRPELFAHVRFYLNTFDLMHPSTVRTFLNASSRRLPVWAQSWGQSEVGPIAGALYTRAMVRRRGVASTNNVGWSVPWLIRTRVVDPETGEPVRRGRTGILMSRSRSRCIDYLGETDRHELKSAGEWWNTGDLGYKDLLGRVRFVDRAVDEIPGLSGTELESILLDRIPNAIEVIVLGVSGSAPLPVLSLDGGSISDAEWRAATKGLPAMADPVVIAWEDLPRTSTWKVRRGALRRSLVGTELGDGVSTWT